MTIVETIACDESARISLRMANMPDGSQVRYMWSEVPSGDMSAGQQLLPVLYKNGFNDSFDTLDGKTTVMQAYAKEGINAVMIDPLPAGTIRRLGSVRRQAEHTLDALTAIGLHQDRLPAVGYCVGAQIVAETVALAAERGLDCFQDAPVVLLTPTGLNDNESPLNFFGRGLREGLAARSNPEPSLLENDPMAANNTELIKAVMRHPFSSLQQYWTMTTGRIELDTLMEQVGSLGVVALHNDHLMPEKNLSAVHDILSRETTTAQPDTISLWMPYGIEDAPDGHILGVRDSSHVDPFRYPRVPQSIAQFLLSRT